MAEKNVIIDKSTEFALKIIEVYKDLCTTKKEFVLSKQLLRCGTSIGANATEAVNAQSKADFYAKMYIAFKEANKTVYWLNLLHKSKIIDDITFYNLYKDGFELVKILSAITKSRNNHAS